MDKRRIIGNAYVLEERIGETHLGDIFVAKMLGKKDRVRINLLSDYGDLEMESIVRFMQEIDVLRELKHVNLWSVIDSGKDEDVYFFVTPYEPSLRLDEYLMREKVLDERFVLELASMIAKVLDYIWKEKKLVHRNIKPQNIFVTRHNEIRLTGFDIAKMPSSGFVGVTGAGYTMGTPEYMSPEQIRAREALDFRSDMYSLGIVMYEALTGNTPFNDVAPVMVIHKQCEEAHVPIRALNRDISPACTAMVDRMLEKDRDDRYESWDDVKTAAREATATVGKRPSPLDDFSASRLMRSAEALKALLCTPKSAIIIISAALNIVFLIVILYVLSK